MAYALIPASHEGLLISLAGRDGRKVGDDQLFRSIDTTKTRWFRLEEISHKQAANGSVPLHSIAVQTVFQDEPGSPPWTFESQRVLQREIFMLRNRCAKCEEVLKEIQKGAESRPSENPSGSPSSTDQLRRSLIEAQNRVKQNKAEIDHLKAVLLEKEEEMGRKEQQLGRLKKSLHRSEELRKKMSESVSEIRQEFELITREIVRSDVSSQRHLSRQQSFRLEKTLSPQSSKSVKSTSKSSVPSSSSSSASSASKGRIDSHGSHLEAVVKRMSDPHFIRLMEGIAPEELVDQLEMIVLSTSTKSKK